MKNAEPRTWYKIEEKGFPLSRVPVVFFGKKCGPVVGHYTRGAPYKDRPWYSEFGWYGDEVTHWYPLPIHYPETTSMDLQSA